MFRMFQQPQQFETIWSLIVVSYLTGNRFFYTRLQERLFLLTSLHLQLCFCCCRCVAQINPIRETKANRGKRIKRPAPFNPRVMRLLNQLNEYAGKLKSQ